MLKQMSLLRSDDAYISALHHSGSLPFPDIEVSKTTDLLDIGNCFAKGGLLCVNQLPPNYFLQIISVTMALEQIIEAPSVSQSQATIANIGTLSILIPITCQAQSFQNLEGDTHTVAILEARWKVPGVLRKTKTYAWNCVKYLLVVCIIFLPCF